MAERHWILYVCTVCHAEALGWPEELVHLRNQCPGQHDRSLIQSIVLVPKK